MDYIQKLKEMIDNPQDHVDYEGNQCEITLKFNEVWEHDERNHSNDPYVDFIHNFKGGSLYKVEDIGGLELYTYDEVGRACDYLKQIKEANFPFYIFPLGKVIGEDSYFAYRADGIFYVTVEDGWNLRVKICERFDEFILRFIEEKGRPFWLDVPVKTVLNRDGKETVELEQFVSKIYNGKRIIYTEVYHLDHRVDPSTGMIDKEVQNCHYTKEQVAENLRRLKEAYKKLEEN